jgi:RNase P subunit RPR2
LNLTYANLIINNYKLPLLKKLTNNSMASFRGMRFCKECDNMLQPKEQRTGQGDQDIGRLIYDCRICGYFEKAKPDDEADHCVYRSSEPQSSSGP